MEDMGEIKNSIKTHFSNLYTEEWGLWLRIDGLPLSRISDQQAAGLKHPFEEEEEVKVAIWMMEGDKALGPDGFPILFYKSF